jgi:hypothetical protein
VSSQLIFYQRNVPNGTSKKAKLGLEILSAISLPPFR